MKVAPSMTRHSWGVKQEPGNSLPFPHPVTLRVPTMGGFGGGAPLQVFDEVPCAMSCAELMAEAAV